MRKPSTIEEKIIQQYAPDSCLLDMALKRPSDCIRYVKAIDRHRHTSYDTLLLGNLPEALLSPVDWIRERAIILARQTKK